MKTGFKDRLEVKIKTTKMKSPWNFDAPQYDERSSCFLCAGTYYGEGKAQPIGTKVHSSEGGVPKGRVSTLRQCPPDSMREMQDDQT